MKGVKCPMCKHRFYISGNIPKLTMCDKCKIYFLVEYNRTKIRDFFDRLKNKWRRGR